MPWRAIGGGQEIIPGNPGDKRGKHYRRSDKKKKRNRRNGPEHQVVQLNPLKYYRRKLHGISRIRQLQRQKIMPIRIRLYVRPFSYGRNYMKKQTMCQKESGRVSIPYGLRFLALVFNGNGNPEGADTSYGYPYGGCLQSNPL